MSSFQQLSAAAGSGKTYALTERFLSLLSKANSSDRSVLCSGATSASYCWPEILAATFTNKAAAEMKERVLASIKRTALEIPDGQKASQWSPQQAEAVLDRILRSYNQLGIRTIDSLLGLLLRVFALELGLHPDFELIFDSSGAMQDALDHIISACAEGDETLIALYTHALDTALYEESVETKKSFGFSLEKRLANSLFDLTKSLLARPEILNELVTDQSQLRQMLLPSFKALTHALDALLENIHNNKLAPCKNFTKFLDKCTALDFFDAVPQSTYAGKETLTQCVLKESKKHVLEHSELCWQKFREACQCYQNQHAALKQAIFLAPSLELAKHMLKYLYHNEQKTGKVLGSTLASRTQHLLDVQCGVPDAFCRLGNRLHHLLIDEFQDTSREQWAAIDPLAEECLSKGGSLFYVGDVKQAIYGWRGGDASLFEEIAKQTSLCRIQSPECKTLHLNWRSQKAIVDFNNDLFALLVRPDFTENFANALFKKYPPQYKAHFIKSLQKTYATAKQTLPPDRKISGGYVRLEQIQGGLSEDIKQQTLKRIEEIIMTELASCRKFSEICILIRNKDHASLLSDALMQRDIPVITESSLRMGLHPIPRQLAALLSIVDFPGNDIAFTQFITGDLFLAASGLDRQTMYDWLSTREQGSLYLTFSKAFPEVWNTWLAPFINQAGLMTPYDLAEDAARAFNVLKLQPQSELFLKRFLELIHKAQESGHSSLSDFLYFWNNKGQEEQLSLPDSVDAVRIMTIHKAKGLEFPVVLLPFVHWPLSTASAYQLMQLEGKNFFTKLGQSLGAPYYEKKIAEAQEQLNLLYVALTRAKEELYVLLPHEVRGSKIHPVHTMLDLAFPFLDQGEKQSGIPYLEWGHALKKKQKKLPIKEARASSLAPSIEEESKVTLMSWLPRLRVYRHLKQLSLDAKLRGEIAHKAMEFLKIPVKQNAQTHQAALIRARSLALQEFPLLAGFSEFERRQLTRDLDTMLAWVLKQAPLRHCLGKGQSEVDIIDHTGSLKRPDFIHFGKNETIILEFKTGEHHQKHHAQLEAYMKTVFRCTHTDSVQGFLVYLDLHIMEELPRAPREH